jgi:transposase-like protein
MECERITTDKNPAYPKAIAELFTGKVKQRTSKYLNNRIEQDHRDIKSRYYPMRGFKDFLCAFIFCTVFEEVRNFFRIPSSKDGFKLKSSKNRKIIVAKFQEFQKIMSIF